MLGINSVDIDELTLPEAEGLLIGEVGTQLTLRGRRGLCGSEYTVTLDRELTASSFELEPSGAVLAAVARARAKQIQHDLCSFEALFALDVGTRKQFRAWAWHCNSTRQHHGMLRCLLRRRYRKILEAQVLLPWHHYAREMKRRSRAVSIASHSRNKAQVTTWFHAWLATQTSMSTFRTRGSLMLEQKRRRVVRLFMGMWAGLRLEWKVLKTREEQGRRQERRRNLQRFLLQWRTRVHSQKTWRHQIRLASGRASQSVVGKVFGLWAAYVRFERRILGKQLRLRRQFRGRLLHRVMRHLRRHVSELRAEERLCRAHDARSRKEMCRLWRSWVDGASQRRRLSVTLVRLLQKKRGYVLRSVWEMWSSFARHIWSILRKCTASARRIIIVGALKNWTRQSAWSRTLGQKFGKILQRLRRHLLQIFFLFWHHSAVTWVAFREVLCYISILPQHSVLLRMQDVLRQELNPCITRTLESILSMPSP